MHKLEKSFLKTIDKTDILSIIRIKLRETKANNLRKVHCILGCNAFNIKFYYGGIFYEKVKQEGLYTR